MTKKNTIMTAIRDEITAGVYTDGERLPGVSELQERFDVSTATAVYAMKALEDEGIVSARQGDGYFAIVNTAHSSEDLLASTRAALIVASNAVKEALLKLDRLTAQSERSANAV